MIRLVPVACLVVLGFVVPALAQGETTVQTLTYSCDRGVDLPATYINAADVSLAVIHVEGRQITLYNEPAASGARYGWPSDGSSYVWWTKGPEATLYWKDGAAGTEEPILENCVEKG